MARTRPNKAQVFKPRPLSKAEREEMEAFDESELPFFRPVKRCDCKQVPRPCPYVSCKWNNYLDIHENGNIRINFPGMEPDEIPAHLSCTLDMIDEYDRKDQRIPQSVVGEATGSCLDSVKACTDKAIAFMRLSTAVERVDNFHEYAASVQINWTGDDDGTPEERNQD